MNPWRTLTAAVVLGLLLYAGAAWVWWWVASGTAGGWWHAVLLWAATPVGRTVCTVGAVCCAATGAAVLATCGNTAPGARVRRHGL